MLRRWKNVSNGSFSLLMLWISPHRLSQVTERDCINACVAIAFNDKEISILRDVRGTWELQSGFTTQARSNMLPKHSHCNCCRDPVAAPVPILLQSRCTDLENLYVLARLLASINSWQNRWRPGKQHPKEAIWLLGDLDKLREAQRVFSSLVYTQIKWEKEISAEHIINLSKTKHNMLSCHYWTLVLYGATLHPEIFLI